MLRVRITTFFNIQFTSFKNNFNQYKFGLKITVWLLIRLIFFNGMPISFITACILLNFGLCLILGNVVTFLMVAYIPLLIGWFTLRAGARIKTMPSACQLSQTRFIYRMYIVKPPSIGEFVGSYSLSLFLNAFQESYFLSVSFGVIGLRLIDSMPK